MVLFPATIFTNKILALVAHLALLRVDVMPCPLYFDNTATHADSGFVLENIVADVKNFSVRTIFWEEGQKNQPA